jgi:hypothetical protein
MKIHEGLTKAFDIIKDKSKWTQGVYARDIYGTTVDEKSPEAVCWCSAGICYKVADMELAPILRRYVENMISTGSRYLALYNDGNTHEEVCSLWQKAIAKAKAEGV